MKLHLESDELNLDINTQDAEEGRIKLNASVEASIKKDVFSSRSPEPFMRALFPALAGMLQPISQTPSTTADVETIFLEALDLAAELGLTKEMTVALFSKALSKYTDEDKTPPETAPEKPEQPAAT